jgi:hypothetical protein
VWTAECRNAVLNATQNISHVKVQQAIWLDEVNAAKRVFRYNDRAGTDTKQKNCGVVNTFSVRVMMCCRQTQKVCKMLAERMRLKAFYVNNNIPAASCKAPTVQTFCCSLHSCVQQDVAMSGKQDRTQMWAVTVC